MDTRQVKGFTLVELVIIIVILGILAVAAAPRFLDMSEDAKITALRGVASQFDTTITLVKAKARVEGLQAAAQNPGGSQQAAYVVDFGFGSTEVDWRNLCPESIAESNDRLGMLDFIDVTSQEFETRVNNQYTLIGFDVPSSGTPTDQGCYIIYDSFGDPNCTVQVVTTDC